jgi:hypothetical protein
MFEELAKARCRFSTTLTDLLIFQLQLKQNTGSILASAFLPSFVGPVKMVLSDFVL